MAPASLVLAGLHWPISMATASRTSLLRVMTAPMQTLARTWEPEVARLASAGAPTFTDAPAFGPIAVGDFRNVGYPDVITGASGQYGFLLNNGTAITSFGPAVVYGANPSLIADFNGDGDLDYADIGETAAYGLAGNGNGTFAAARAVAASPVPASGWAQQATSTTSEFQRLQ